MQHSTKAEMLLIENDVQFLVPTAGHFVIEGLKDTKSKVTWYPKSDKLQISKKGNKTQMLEFNSLQECLDYILTIIN